MNFDSALVTGGAGFIGSNLVDKLVNNGIKVAVLDNFSSGLRKNLKRYENDIEIIEGDVRNKDIVTKAVKNKDVIFHLAAVVSVPASLERPVETTDVNVTGTVNLLDAAVKNNVKKLVLASSCAVYGDTENLPIKETQPTKAMSPYAVSKLAGESYCSYYSEYYDIDAISLRYFNVFGPGQSPKSNYAAAIPKFITMMLEGKQPVIYGDGLQTRDFVYVDNVADANILAASQDKSTSKVYNCASSSQISMNTVVETLSKKMKKDILPEYTEARTGDIKHSFADISLIKKELGFSVKIDFEEGLEKTIEYYNGL